DIVPSPLQNLRYSLERRIIGALSPGALERDRGEVGKGALDFAQSATGEVSDGLADSLDDLVEDVAVLLEVLLSLRRDVVHLLAIGIHRADVALVFEELERGVHGAGGGSVVTAHFLFESLDDLVTVPRLLLDESENHELHFTLAEHLASAAR